VSQSYESVSIPAPAGNIHGVIAVPDGVGPHPVVVVFQEAFGFTEQLRGVGRKLLEAGFAVVIPDLYSRDPKRQTLTDEEVAFGFPIFRQPDRSAVIDVLPEDQRLIALKVVDWLDNRDSSQYLPDALATVEWARDQSPLDRARIAVLGFCMGGGLVGQVAAAGAPIAAGVVFYGQIPSAESVAGIRVPLLGNYAETDPSITPKVPEFARLLSLAGVPFSWTVHPGTTHGFFNETRASYHHEASAKAWADTIEFLEKHISDRRKVG